MRRGPVPGARGGAIPTRRYPFSPYAGTLPGVENSGHDMGRYGARATALLVLFAVPAMFVIDAAAQDPTDSTTSTTSTTTTPSTTLPPKGTPDSSTTVPETTTTVPFVPTIPPELVDDPRLPYLVDPGEGADIDIDVAQRSFDPLSVGVLPERVDAARLSVTLAQLDLLRIQSEIASQSLTVAELTGRLTELDRSSRVAVKAAADARRLLRAHAVSAYMSGPVSNHLALLDSHDYTDMGVARSYVDVVVGTQERLTKDYERKRDALSDEHAELADRVGDENSRLAELTTDERTAFVAVLARLEELRAYEAGAHAYIDGFVFPVAGDCEFIDSWGYPRSGGRWHQGADIFARHGTPVIASENGTLDGVGSGTLGGIKLWVNGDSGNEYYYAHLAAFAPDVRNGKKVRAGEVIGYVGDTGNAKGTSPHLHFEIHPDGAGPSNPYPLLKAAYGNRPVVRAVVPTTTTTTVPPVPVVPPAAPIEPSTEAVTAPRPGG